MTAHADQMEARQAGLHGQVPPERHHPCHVGNVEWLVDRQQRLAVHPHIARVAKRGQQILEVAPMVVEARVGLFNQHLAGIAVPDAAPGLVGPAQAEREVRLARGEHFVERPLDDALPGKPVVVIAERFNAILPGKVGLGRTRLRAPKVVKSQIGGNVRLVVSRIERRGLGGVGPLREALAPPSSNAGSATLNASAPSGLNCLRPPTANRTAPARATVTACRPFPWVNGRCRTGRCWTWGTRRPYRSTPGDSK